MRCVPLGLLALLVLTACGGAARSTSPPDDAPADVRGDAAASSPSATAGAATPATRADSVSLEEVRAVITAVGVPDIFQRLGEPSPFLGDFAGVQILADVTRDDVLRDLVPRYAMVVDSGPAALILELRAGPRVDFHQQATLHIDSNPYRMTYARVHLPQPETYPEPVRAFRDVLEQAGLASKYLLPNPYYEEERLALARMNDSASIAPVRVSTDTSRLRAASHAVLLVGDTHGTTEAYDRVYRLLESPDIDWVGIEMVSEDLQGAVDSFLTAPAASRTFADARQRLLDFYEGAWNTRENERAATPAGNPYFRLIERAREHGKRVYALDTPLRYTLFRWGEFPLGGATRDAVWAANIPPSGRGVVYGGSAHFLASRKPNFLTFLRERFPAIQVFQLPS